MQSQIWKLTLVLSTLATGKVFSIPRRHSKTLELLPTTGAGNLLTDGNLLLVAGKIVSVEARHAAAIRDLLNPKSTDFAGVDVVDMNGLDKALMPSEVLTAADPFIKTKVPGNNLPSA